MGPVVSAVMWTVPAIIRCQREAPGNNSGFSRTSNPWWSGERVEVAGCPRRAGGNAVRRQGLRPGHAIIHRHSPVLSPDVGVLRPRTNSWFNSLHAFSQSRNTFLEVGDLPGIQKSIVAHVHDAPFNHEQMLTRTGLPAIHVIQLVMDPGKLLVEIGMASDIPAISPSGP
jgi:hypothetical protein